MKIKENLIELLNEARENGVYPFLENEKLRLKVKEKVTVNPELLAALKLRKEEITNFLHEESDNFKDIQEPVQHIRPYQRDKATRIPLSFAQERLWFLDKLAGSKNYHIPFVLSAKGSLEKTILESAFNAIINRHESLRSVFIEEDGIPFQEIKTENSWSLKFTDIVSSPERQALIVQNEMDEPFNLAKDFMLRAHLIRTGEQEHLLVIVFHHIASDGWSMPIFIQELLHFYRSFKTGRPVTLPELPIQYADYAIWQKDYFSGEHFEKKLNYWKEKLEGVAILDLCTHNERPSTQSFKGNTFNTTLDKELSLQLERISNQEGATLFTTLFNAFTVLLYKYSGQDDICVGIPVANRTQKETEPLIGFFVNTLALRTNLADNPKFTDLLAQVKRTTLEAYSHQNIPFEKVVNKVLKSRETGRSPLFQVMFSLENNEGTQVAEMDDLTLSILPFESGNAKFDLTVGLTRSWEGMNLSIEYSTDLFLKETIERMAMHYRALLSSIILDAEKTIDELEYLDETEKEQILLTCNDAIPDLPVDRTITRLFEDQVDRTPSNIALAFGEIRLTYQELNEKANQVAHYLRAKYGIGPDDLVGINLSRSEWVIIAILGILKSGGAYVPMDPEYPAGRIDFMIADSGCKAVIREEELNWLMVEIECYPGTNPAPVNKSSDLAYVIYTSGTTGNPKGAMIQHNSVVNLFETDNKILGFRPDDVWTLFHSCCFDLSVWEMYGALLHGGRLVVISSATVKDPGAFLELLHMEGVTVLSQTPSSFYTLIRHELEKEEAVLRLRYTILGGESLSPGKLAAWKKRYPATRLMNQYGPTETTMHVTYKEITEKEIERNNSNIGRPIPTVRCYVLDKNKRLLPAGIPGELYIGGPCVARGYLNREELTNQRFIENPFRKNDRLYRSGDKVRILENGDIAYAGRFDEQVKIRGYRIETGEIESVLREMGSIEDAIVLAVEDGETGDKSLAAYIISKGEINVSDIRSHLGSRLPGYMIPSSFVRIETIPLTANGKLDKKALPEPGKGLATGVAYVAPANEKESTLAGIWSEIVGIEKERIGVNDNFFELGGHSLLATKVMAMIKNKYSIQLPISRLFEFPTIKLLAEKLSPDHDEKQEPSILVPISSKGSMPPVFCAPPGGGNVMLYRALAIALGEDQPVYAFQSHGIDLVSAPLRSVQEMAAAFIVEMQKIDPSGPYTLFGYSFGGSVIYEMAIQLGKKGFRVNHLVIFDSTAPDKELTDYAEMLPATYSDWMIHFKDIYSININNGNQELALTRDELLHKSESEQLKMLYDILPEKEKGITIEQLKAYTDVYMINSTISYVPADNGSFGTPIILFKADRSQTAFSEEQVRKRIELTKGRAGREDLGWRDFTTGKVDIYTMPCSHWSLMEDSNARVMAEYIKEHIGANH
jgi:amino acid adenylation domain-containing protein